MIEFEKIKIRESEFVKGAGLFLIPGLCVGVGLAWMHLKKNHFLTKKWSHERTILLGIDGFLFAAVGYLLLYLVPIENSLLRYVLMTMPLALLAYSLGLFILPILFPESFQLKIESGLLKAKISPRHFATHKEDMETNLGFREKIPLGLSYLDHKTFYLDAGSRKRHVIVTGRNGMGKTSFALAMVRHDLFWRRPVIFIDPKSDHNDLNTARTYASKYNRQDDLRFFSTTLKKKSCFYDPLKLGTPLEKASKLVYSLGLEHQHWGSLANTYLTIIFEIYEALKIRPTLNDLEMLFISKEKMSDFFGRVNQIEKTAEIVKLQAKIHRFQKMKDEAFDGLQAGIIALNSKESSPVLNPSMDKNEICIKEAIERKLFLHIDLSIGSDSLKTMIGRLFIKDLSLIADAIQHDLVKMKSDFAGIYIDELDSFADKNFNNFFKRARSANYGLTVLFQGRANLEQISPQLFSQLSQNAETLIDFRASTPEDLDSISRRPGTQEIKKKSQQIDRKSIGQSTGMETISSGEEFVLNPNFTRDLGLGQCIVSTQKQDKKRGGENILDVIWAWDAKGNSETALTKNQVLNQYRNKNPLEDNWQRGFSKTEKQFLRIDPRLWHQRLNYSEIQRARELRLELQERT